MPYKSRWWVDIPHCSLATFLFKSPTESLSNDPVLLDADDPSHCLSLADHRLYCQRVAVGLKKHGFQPGDRLLLFSGNNIYFPSVFLGVTMADGIFSGANPGYVAREVAHQLRDSGARFFLCAANSLQAGLAAAEEVGLPRSQIFVFDDAPNGPSSPEPSGGYQHWSTLLASESESRDFAWNNRASPDEANQTLALNYSSGTTGLSKGVEITHRNYVSNVIQQQFVLDLAKAEESPDVAPETHLCFLPFYHAMAQVIYAVNAPSRGVPVYVMKAFDFVKMMDYLEKYDVTFFMAVPPIIVAMAKHPLVRSGKWDLSKVRNVGAGAAPLGREISQEFESLWKDNEDGDILNIKQGWGMTELTCTGTSMDPTKKNTNASVGELNANCEMKIMSDDGTAEVESGEPGEIWYRGPNVMKGYWKNPKATAETLTKDGWLKTGDVGRVDEHDQLFIVDRRKELIKVKGNQVAPAELEALLLDHPAVADAAVIGVKANDDEAPRAYVVLNEGKKATAKEIAEFVSQRVTKVKRLTGGVHFIDVIPKNPSGKILRKFLRERAAKENGTRAKL